ncbi:MAG: MBOAT family O-acyltransferase [Bacteroidales bacterium]
MIFSTLEFLMFLIVLLFLYYKGNRKHQWFVLLLASSAFLGYLSVNFLLYTYLVIIINYSLGLKIDSLTQKKSRYYFYLAGIVLNIGQLVFFKYINFLINNLNSLFGIVSEESVIPYLNIIIPVGISYYTFEGIGYLIEVYRGSSKAEKHFGLFASYILFFPKLLAGPIERSKTMLPALRKRYSVDMPMIYDGLVLIFWGLFKKLVIADRLVLLVNNVYGDVQDYTGFPLIMTFVLQVFHIYCDFSGYTDIALGIGKLFGIKLTDNFDRPLFAQNVSMFWRKWHITLSSWCNDYIFKRILLKRIRWKKWAAVYGVFVTFLIIGIWHGSGWNFIILGALQGVAINYEFFTKRQRLRIASKINQYWVRFFSRIIVFLFFALTLVFFNAKNVTDASYFLTHLFSGIELKITGYNIGVTHFDYVISFIGILVVLFVDYTHERGIHFREALKSRPVLKWSIYYGLVFVVLMFGKFAASDFVYFQF